MPVFLSSGVSGHTGACVPGRWYSGVLVFRGVRVHEYRGVGIQGCRGSLAAKSRGGGGLVWRRVKGVDLLLAQLEGDLVDSSGWSPLGRESPFGENGSLVTGACTARACGPCGPVGSGPASAGGCHQHVRRAL